MRKIIFNTLAVILSLSSFAQIQTQIVGDSIRLHSNTGSGEFILENNTKTVNGFLFNKNNGRTEFRQGLIQISTDKYLVGYDTLDLSGIVGAAASDLQQVTNTGNLTTTNINAASFIGSADATINGLTVGRGGGNLSSNVALGVGALPVNTSGIAIAIGQDALKNNTTGHNIAIGFQAMYNNIDAGASLTSTSAIAPSIAIGYQALYTNATKANASIAIGHKALYSTYHDFVLGATLGSNGCFNIAVGNYTLQNNTTGLHNIAIGYLASQFTTTGYSNTMIGSSAGKLNTSGSWNTYLGRRAGYANISGNYNTAIGYEAGWNNVGSSNIFLGYNAGSGETGSNKLYIANSATTTPLIYGDFATSHLRINGTLELSGATGAGYVLTDISGNGNLSLQPPSGSSASNKLLNIHSQSIKTDNLNVGMTGDYADNAAAVAAGLVAGDVYRTGDILKVVH